MNASKKTALSIRLREATTEFARDYQPGELMRQAADEIERLQAENAELQKSREEWVDRTMSVQRQQTASLFDSVNRQIANLKSELS